MFHLEGQYLALLFKLEIMKKKYYDVGTFMYLRSQKRGLETAAIIGIAAAGASAIAGTASAISSKNAADNANAMNVQLTEEAMEQQKELFHEGNKFNAEQAKIAREFNAEESQINRDWQANMLKENIAWYEKYNSPSAQYQRYIDAGLNPSTLSGNLGSSPSFSIGSGSAASATPATASSAPSVPQGHVQPAALDFSKVLQGALGDASSIFGTLGQKEDLKSKQTFNDYYDDMLKAGLDVDRNTARRLWKEGNMIDEQTAMFRTSVDKIISDIGLQEKQGKLYDKEGNLLDEKILSQQIDNLWKNEDWQLSLHLKASQLHLSREQERWCSALLKAQISEHLGLAANANAQAALAAATADLRGEEKVAAQKYAEYLSSGTSLNNLELSIFDNPEMIEERKNFEKKKWQLDIEGRAFENSWIMKGARFLNQVAMPLTSIAAIMMLRNGKTPPTTKVKPTEIITNAPLGSVPGM